MQYVFSLHIKQNAKMIEKPKIPFEGEGGLNRDREAI